MKKALFRYFVILCKCGIVYDACACVRRGPNTHLFNSFAGGVFLFLLSQAICQKYVVVGLVRRDFSTNPGQTMTGMTGGFMYLSTWGGTSSWTREGYPVISFGTKPESSRLGLIYIQLAKGRHVTRRGSCGY